MHLYKDNKIIQKDIPEDIANKMFEAFGHGVTLIDLGCDIKSAFHEVGGDIPEEFYKVWFDWACYTYIKG